MHGRVTNDLPTPPHASRPTPVEWASDGFDIWAIWSLFLRRWPVVVAALAVALTMAFVWLIQTTPLYTANAQILLDPRRKNPLPGESLVAELQLMDYSAVETEIKLISSFAVANRAVERLKLTRNPNFNIQSSPGLWSALKDVASLFWASPEDGEEVSEPSPKDGPSQSELAATARVQEGMAVKRVETTYFIDVSFTHPDPDVAALVANGIADAYLVEQLEARYLSSKRSADWLGERTAKLRQQLEVAETAVAEHRAKYNLMSPKSGSISEQQATEINAQLVAARAHTVEKKVLYEQASRLLSGSAKLDSVAAVMQSPIISALRQQEADIARQEADLMTRYGPEHPNVLKIKAESRDLRRQVNSEVSRVVANLKSDLEFATSKERSLETTIKELTGAENRNDGAVIRLRELEREAGATKTLYETLLTRFKEAEQQQSLASPESRVVAPAAAPGGPSFPDKRRVLMVATVLGLALGIGLSLLLEHFERGFSTVEQAETALKLPVLAIVPRITPAECKIGDTVVNVPEIVLRKPLSRFGESIRSARVGIQLSDVDRTPKVILVTSSVPSEGKTTVALSLAYSAAMANLKVLLIDCDLRHPSTTMHFDLLKSAGLTDFLAEKKAAQQSFFRGPTPGLTLLPAGSTTLHPPDLLGSLKFKQLLATVQNAYDLVIIDAPPVTPVIDSVLLSKVVDKVVLVVNWRSTPQEVVQRTLSALRDPRPNIAGIIFNNAELGSMSRYSGYYNYYSKSYDKYYTS